LYRPLNTDNQEIRLLQITPIEKPTNPIRLRLRHVSLLDKPIFNALSYTWGAPFAGLLPEWDDPNATHTVLINNKEIQIRWNLEAALRHFTRVATMPYQLWVDAICINQSDLREKSSQITLMPSIYRNSLACLIWLGPASDDSDLAFSAIIHKGKTLKYKWFVEEKLRPHGKINHLVAIKNLFLRKWWRRVWV
ncbi:heterokaryon incompatibility protein-domain-containing protein, partial [Phaeosphaeriaceae sp. PMI808]